MEEKDRYEVISPSLNGYAYIHDFKTDNVLNTYDSCNLLNQQDKENEQLKQQLAELREQIAIRDEENGKIFMQSVNAMRENVELKQQLHDLPKKIVGEIRDVAGEYWDFNICKECGNVPVLNTLTTKDFDEILDIILKKYGEEDE